MIHIALYQPEIPPNTGNIIRLCANSGFFLHLIKPLGFQMDDKRLRRAGLDYSEWASVTTHQHWDAFFDWFKQHHSATGGKLYACTTKGSKFHSEIDYQASDTLLFGPETRGLPSNVLSLLSKEEWVKIPMKENSRSLNLSNSVAIFIFEAWRQLEFRGCL